MYKPSKHVATFFVAGFQHHDGCLALGKLKPGKKLKMVPEPDNPFDPDAIELRYKGAKLGYVPRDHNKDLALLAFYGHEGVYEARVMQVDPEADPWQQVRVGLYVTDNRP